MYGVSFITSIGKHPSTKEHQPVAVFSRDTKGRSLALEMFPDSTERYYVDGANVDQLPNVPSSRQLRFEVDRLKSTALAMLSMERGSSEWCAEWRRILDALES